MGGWVDDWLGEWVDGRMDGWMDGRMGGWADGWMDGRRGVDGSFGSSLLVVCCLGVAGSIDDSIVLLGVMLNKFGSCSMASLNCSALLGLYSFPSGVVSAL